MNQTSDEILKVRVISPKTDFFNGPALSVSSENSLGKFDILPEHANFISLIQDAPITIRKQNEEQVVFKFPLAIICNIKNNVTIYTDIQTELTLS